MKSTDHKRVSLRSRQAHGWRSALRALVSPAMRVHDYRNLHKAMFYDAVCEWDCRKKP